MNAYIRFLEMLDRMGSAGIWPVIALALAGSGVGIWLVSRSRNPYRVQSKKTKRA